jgi:hypothetical protein
VVVDPPRGPMVAGPFCKLVRPYVAVRGHS